MNKNILFIGFKHTGKTTVGKALAKTLQKNFYDLDNLIQEEFTRKHHLKLTSRQIMKKYGETFFRNLEIKVFIHTQKKLKNSIFSLGGGIIDRLTISDFKKYASKESNIIIHLTATPEVAYNRIIQNGVPVFFPSQNPEKYFHQLWNIRKKMYQAVADFTIMNNHTVEFTVKNILKKLKAISSQNLVSPALNAVIGYPLHHTKSPLLHQLIYDREKLNAILIAFPHPKINDLIKAVKTLSIELTAVTMPYKEKVLKYCEYLSPEVKKLKAANTIIQRQHKLYAYNTDVDGIAFALRNIVLQHKKILIIGAGGAARALGYYLSQHQTILYWTNRTPHKLNKLIKIFGGKKIPAKHLKLLCNEIDIIVNTTPIGMSSNSDHSPIPLDFIRSKHIVFDLIYNPFKTLLLQYAEKKKAKTLSGIDMFIGQAIRQVELWSGKKMTLYDKKIYHKLKSKLQLSIGANS